MPGDAREPSGRRRLLAADRLVLPPCWTAARTTGYSRTSAQRLRPLPQRPHRLDPTPDELTGV